MKLKILSILLSLAVLAGYGQETKKSPLKVTSTGFSIGFAAAGTANTTEDYNNLKASVNDASHFIDASDYNYSSYNFGIGGNFNPKIYLGFSPYSKSKGEYRKDRELRLSIGSGAGIRRNFSFYKYDNFTIDTLVSGSTGNEVYADSVNYSRYTYAETFFDFNFGITFLFKTNTERRVHFSAGAGLEYAYAFRSFVNVSNYSDRKVEYYEPNNKPDYDEKDGFFDFDKDKDNSYSSKYNKNINTKGSLHFVRVLLPLSLNFRISNKTASFFNHVYVFTEMAPGIEFQIVGSDKTYVNPYFGAAMLGFSYRW